MKLYALVWIIMLVVPLGAQEEFIRGNKAYENQQYPEAIEWYEKALEKNPTSPQLLFNLGNAYYRDQKFEKAEETFNKLLQNPNISREMKSHAYYNLGNALLQQRKIDDAITQYISALRLNPFDEDARYNLTYALKKRQKHGGKSSQNNKSQQQQNKQDRQKQPQQEQQKKEQSISPNQQQLSDRQVEQLLQGLRTNDKDIQKELQKMRINNETTKGHAGYKDW